MEKTTINLHLQIFYQLSSLSTCSLPAKFDRLPSSKTFWILTCNWLLMSQSIIYALLTNIAVRTRNTGTKHRCQFSCGFATLCALQVCHFANIFVFVSVFLWRATLCALQVATLPTLRLACLNLFSIQENFQKLICTFVLDVHMSKVYYFQFQFTSNFINL